MPKMSVRRWWVAAAACLVAGVWAVSHLSGTTRADTATSAATASKGGVNIDSLGNMLQGLGLKPTKTESRYDFQFADKKEEEWELSMSVVLSNDEKTLWIMAWLDELPPSAADVPRVALLRLLSDNDKMGNGQFFAYVASNKRFVLQRVIKNENITSASMRADLKELGKTVMNTYGHWAVASWKQLGNTASAPETTEAEPAATDKPATRTGAKTPATSVKK